MTRGPGWVVCGARRLLASPPISPSGLCGPLSPALAWPACPALTVATPHPPHPPRSLSLSTGRAALSPQRPRLGLARAGAPLSCVHPHRVSRARGGCAAGLTVRVSDQISRLPGPCTCPSSVAWASAAAVGSRRGLPASCRSAEPSRRPGPPTALRREIGHGAEERAQQARAAGGGQACSPPGLRAPRLESTR